MKYELEIKLKSDLCASSGESMGSYIDSDVCYDDNGIPYIPSKRIKGLLRECAEEYCEWNESLKEYINTIFGTEGAQNPGKLKIDNAYIKDYETVTDELNEITNVYVSKQRIINSFTYTRYQTAIDENTGRSLDNSLRTTRVIKQGNVFVASIDIDAEEKEIKLLKNASKLCQHMGMSRTRGYGEVVCDLNKIDDNNSIKKIDINLEDNTECEIKLLLKAESEIMVSKQNAEITEIYIPGSNILGSIAKKYLDENKIDFENISDEFINLFLNGNVKYNNAYITDKSEKTYYPIPFSYTKVKNAQNEFYNKMFDVTKENLQLSGITGKFVTLDGTDFIKEVDQTENYHHQRPKDKSIGHAIPKESGGTLYQYTAIAKNQYFLGKITGKACYLKQIANYITEGEVLRVGKSKSTEYGKLVIKDVKISEVKNEEKIYKKFAVILTSNNIVMKDAQVTTDKEAFVNILKEKLGQNIELERAFINYEKVSGYNIIWNLPKEQLESFKAGSVFVFNCDEGVNLKSNYTIGQKQSEGYGNFVILDLEGKNSELHLNKYIEETKSKNINEISNQTKEILKRTLEDAISDEIIDDVINTVSGEYKLNNSTIGRILLMLKQSKDITEFYRNVSSIKNDKKLKRVEALLKGKEQKLLELDSVICYEKIIGKETLNYEKYKMEYIKQILMQLKIEGGEN